MPADMRHDLLALMVPAGNTLRIWELAIVLRRGLEYARGALAS